IGRLWSGDDNVIGVRQEIILQLQEGLADIALDAVSSDRIADFLADGQAETKFFLVAFQQIYDELPIRKRFSFFENALKLRILLDPLLLIHFFTCYLLILMHFRSNSTKKKKKTTDAVSGL